MALGDVLKNVYIFDLDGTIADCTHRLHFISDGRKAWKSFYKACGDDAPIEASCDLARSLYANNEVWILTGRGMEAEVATASWLAKHHVPYTMLIMRPVGDNTPTDELKERWAKGYNLASRAICAFDDNPKHAAMYRKLGITCYLIGI